VAEVIQQVNVRPSSVVFIDDNPVEREAVKQAFPEIRVLGDELYTIRRALLWSSETQVPVISAESAQRTKMVQAQIDRESARSRLSKEEFLASLNVKISGHVIKDVDDPRFNRSFELLNKTNQFNTTGKRWRFEEISSMLAEGNFLYAVEVSDKYTAYGLVALAVCIGSTIAQFVMSCRVIGLGVEIKSLNELCDLFQGGGATDVTAISVATEENHLSRDLFERSAFTNFGDHWKKQLLHVDRAVEGAL
jgi:FkbH-like protein